MVWHRSRGSDSIHSNHSWKPSEREFDGKRLDFYSRWLLIAGFDGIIKVSSMVLLKLIRQTKQSLDGENDEVFEPSKIYTWEERNKSLPFTALHAKLTNPQRRNILPMMTRPKERIPLSSPSFILFYM
jgi:hypothetical protein